MLNPFKLFNRQKKESDATEALNEINESETEVVLDENGNEEAEITPTKLKAVPDVNPEIDNINPEEETEEKLTIEERLLGKETKGMERVEEIRKAETGNTPEKLSRKHKRQIKKIKRSGKRNAINAFRSAGMFVEYGKDEDRKVYARPKIKDVEVVHSSMLTLAGDGNDITRLNSITIITASLPTGVTIKMAHENVDIFRQVFNCKYVDIEEITARILKIKVRHRDLPKMITYDFDQVKKHVMEKKMKIPIIFGYDQNGNLIAKDMKSVPHLGMGASTGAGKSSLFHTILNTLIMLDLDIDYHLGDLKGTEMTLYKDVKKVKEVTTTTMGVLSMLKDMKDLINTRYAILEKYDVANISDIEPEVLDIINLEVNMKTKFIVVDELAMLDAKGDKKILDEIFTYIKEITAKGRACEIYLVLAAQRLDSTAIPGFVKNNLRMTVALAMENATSARTTLKGAEMLKGAGHALVKVLGETTEIQVPYVELKELKKNLKPFKIDKEAEPLPHEIILAKMRKGNNGGEANEPLSLEALVEEREKEPNKKQQPTRTKGNKSYGKVIPINDSIVLQHPSLTVNPLENPPLLPPNKSASDSESIPSLSEDAIYHKELSEQLTNTFMESLTGKNKTDGEKDDLNKFFQSFVVPPEEKLELTKRPTPKGRGNKPDIE